MVAALIGGRCQLLPVMVAVALVFLLCVLVRRSHRSEVATFADGRTVRRLGDGCRSVFLLRVRVYFVIGGHCQLLPLGVPALCSGCAALIARRWPPLQTVGRCAASVMVAARCSCSVSGCALSSVAVVSCCR